MYIIGAMVMLLKYVKYVLIIYASCALKLITLWKFVAENDTEKSQLLWNSI